MNFLLWSKTVAQGSNQSLHWINVWAEQCKQDKDWCVIHNSWRDISKFLNDRDITEILKCKYDNEDYYNYIKYNFPFQLHFQE